MRPRKRVSVTVDNEEIACHVRMLIRQGSLYKLTDDKLPTLAYVRGLGSSGVTVSRVPHISKQIIVPYDANFAAMFLDVLKIVTAVKRGPRVKPVMSEAREIGARAAERYAKEVSE